MTSTFTSGDGRVWLQTKKFQPFELLLPYGLTNVTDPVGGMTAIREPDPGRRRKSVIVDIIRGEANLPEFQLETRLHTTHNYMLGLKDCAVNFQVHLGACNRPDNYYASQIAMHWQRAHRGDLGIDRFSKIEGDNAPVNMQVPFSAEVGPILIDFDVEFISPRSIAETDGITGAKFLDSECLEDCRSQESAGMNGYIVTAPKAGSPINVANVWYTTDGGETWQDVSAKPFGGGESIVGPVIIGSKANHRIVVARATSDPAAPAEIAYGDVSAIGTVTWVNVNVGSVNGEYITALAWPDYRHLYAATADGGHVYISKDGGATWSIALTAADDLATVAVIARGPAAGTVWAAGTSDECYMSEDYGVTWTAVIAPTGNYTALTITPDDTVFLGLDDGTLYGSYDGGSSWTALPAQGVVPTGVTALGSWGDFIIWAAVDTASGGRVLRSVDGGASFRLWNLNLPANSGLTCLEVVDPNIVYVGGNPHNGVGFVTKTTSQVIGV